MKVKSESEVAQSYPTLSDFMDCSPLGSSIHVIFQARVLEWGAIAFSTHDSWPKSQNIQNRSHIVTNSLKTLKMAHIKKKKKRLVVLENHTVRNRNGRFKEINGKAVTITEFKIIKSCGRGSF